MNGVMDVMWELWVDHPTTQRLILLVDRLQCDVMRLERESKNSPENRGNHKGRREI